VKRPLAVDLCSGLGGWACGLEAEGWDVIRVDIEDMFASTGMPKPDNCLLMLQNIRTIHGSQFRHVDLIVGSSPCQEFSYRGMPWKRAKALGPPLLGIELFETQFRIQHEAVAAAGRPIPMVVENVRNAQRYVGRARWNCGSYYLWGDVPALMPRIDARKVPGFRFDGSGASFQTASVRQGRFNDHPRTPDSISSSGSRSPARKAASAKIAKIPLPLSRYIGAVYRPRIAA